MSYDTRPAIVVPDIAALTHINGYVGLFVYVETVECQWRYVTNSGEFTIDHITVEATADGGATVWVRELNYFSPIWLQQVEQVYIDPINGNDENQGFYTTPQALPASIQTWAEFVRRVGTHVFIGPPSTVTSITAMNIHWLSDQPDFKDPVTPTQIMHDVPFVMDGMLIQVGSGTFGAVTNINQAGNIQTTGVNADGLAPANYWTQFYGMLVHDTSNDTWFRVDRDLGTRTAQFTQPFVGTPMLPLALNALGTINLNDNYVVYRFPSVHIGLSILEPFSSDAATVFTFFNHLHCVTDGGTGMSAQNSSTNNFVLFQECTIDGLAIISSTEPEQIFIYNCYFTGGFAALGCTIIGGGVDSFLDAEYSTFLDGNVIVHGTSEIWGEVGIGFAYFDASTLDVPFYELAAPYRGIIAISNYSSLYGGAAIWGPTKLQIHINGTVFYDGSATTQLLQTLGTAIAGLTTAAKVTPGTPRIINDGVAITNANIDDTTGGKLPGMVGTTPEGTSGIFLRGISE